MRHKFHQTITWMSLGMSLGCEDVSPSPTPTQEVTDTSEVATSPTPEMSPSLPPATPPVPSPTPATPTDTPVDSPTPDESTPTRDPGTPTPETTPPPTATPTEAPTPVEGALFLLNEVGCHGDDFVEITNRTSEEVSIAGWGLTDNPLDPSHLYVFPRDTVLPPHGYQVVYAETDTSPGLNFGLKCGSDGVALLKPDGSTAETLTVPDVTENNSWGRIPDGGTIWAENKPTPGGPNTLPDPPTPPEDASSVFDPLNLSEVALTLPQSSIDALYAAPYEYAPATFTFTQGDTTSASLSVGVRIKGRWGSYRTLDSKPALKVKFDYDDKDGRFLGLRKMTLNNMVQDPSMFHEVLAYELFRGAGIAAPRVGYSWVTINGADYGLYTNIETYDKISLGDTYPTTQHLYEGAYGTDVWQGAEFNFEVDEGDSEERTDLALLADINTNYGEEDWFQHMQGVADLEQMTLVWLIENYIGHWDGYAPTINNYYLHSDDAGLFTMFPWGTDQTFGAWLGYHTGGGALFWRCMESSSCRTLYDTHLVELLPVVDDLDLPTLAAAVATYIEPWAAADPRKEYTVDDIHYWQDQTVAYLRLKRAEAAELATCLKNPRSDTDHDGYKCDLDCGEGDATIHPGAAEICSDGIDQDCSGAADDAKECPDCTQAFAGPHRYLFCTWPRPWEEAQQHCRDNGSELAIITSAGENRLIMNAMNSTIGAREAWHGLNDLTTEGLWQWWDTTAVSYQNWSPGEPNDAGGEDCGHFWGDGTWNDIPCTTGLSTVCEDTCAPGEDGDQDGYLRCGDDCDDANPAVHPGGTEICGDGIDQNCDGTADESASCEGGPTDTCVDVVVAGWTGYLCTGSRSWPDAEVSCEAMGGQLASFDSAQQQNEVVTRAQNDGVPREMWFGLQDQRDEGEYYWVNGDPPSYINWANGQPNNGNGTAEQDCVRLLSDGTWNDTDCALTYNYLCRVIAVE